MGDFKKLRAWQEAKSLAVLSRAAIRRLPTEEQYALGHQWRRAVDSVALNIAEGASRTGPRQFRKFLDIALASLHELEAILELVEELDYQPAEQLRMLQLKRSNCARMVYGLLRKMAARSR